MVTQHVIYVNTDSGDAQRSQIVRCFDCSVVCAFLLQKGKIQKRLLFFFVTICADFCVGYWELSPSRLIFLPTIFLLSI